MNKQYLHELTLVERIQYKFYCIHRKLRKNKKKNALDRWVELMCQIEEISGIRRCFYIYLNGLDNQKKFDYMYLTCPWNQGEQEFEETGEIKWGRLK